MMHKLSLRFDLSLSLVLCALIWMHQLVGLVLLFRRRAPRITILIAHPALLAFL